jgi:hypothetical protein
LLHREEKGVQVGRLKDRKFEIAAAEARLKVLKRRLKTFHIVDGAAPYIDTRFTAGNQLIRVTNRSARSSSAS